MITISYKARKASLATTVAFSAIFANAISPNSAVAQAFYEYTGTQAEYDALVTNPVAGLYSGKTFLPPENTSQSKNVVKIHDPLNLGATYKKAGAVFGGYSGGTGEIIVENNQVEMSGGKVDSLYGGAGTNTAGNLLTIRNNLVRVTGGKSSEVYGGYADLSKIANPGHVIVQNNRVEVAGGSVRSYLNAANVNSTGQFSVIGNSLEISDGIHNAYVAGVNANQMFSDQAVNTSVVKENRVRVTGGSVNNIAGARVSNMDAGLVSVSNNVLELTGGTALSLAAVDLLGDDFNISGNKAIITGGVVRSVVTGVHYYDVGRSSHIEVQSNKVFISGKSKIGGFVYGSLIALQENGTANIKNNSVTLVGDEIDFRLSKPSAGYSYSNIFGASVSRYGIEEQNYDIVGSGHTLNLIGYKGTVGGFYNFENYNWVLPTTVADGDVLVNVGNDGIVDLSKTHHAIGLKSDGNRLNVGDEIVLIDKARGDLASVPTEIGQGHFLVYDVDAGINKNDQFVLTIKESTETDDGEGEGDAGGEGARINPRAKALLKGRMAALGFVSQGSDLIATAGLDNIRVMARAADNDWRRPAFLPFLITKDSSQRLISGGHVDLNGFQMAAGVATGLEFEQGHKVTLGAFYEYGRATYDSHSRFSKYPAVYGNGDTDYNGGGIFGRMDFAGTGLGRVAELAPTQADGLYLEASLRTGTSHLNFDSELKDAEGRRGAYTNTSTYWGGHAGAGYVFNFDEQRALDVYGRYLWTRLGSEMFYVGADKARLDASLSSRLQFGGRYSFAYNDQFKPYLGGAYEYEFDGDVGASAYNKRVHEQSLQGSTGIFEAGFTYTPSAKTPDLSINLNAQAFVGQRRGGSGEVKLKYQF